MTWILWGVAALFALVKIGERVTRVQKAKRETTRRQIRRQTPRQEEIEMAVYEGPVARTASHKARPSRSIGVPATRHATDSGNVAPSPENLQ